MRDRSTTISPMAYIPRRIDVSVVSEPTAPAPKHFPMPLFFLYPSAARAGDGSVGRRDQRNRDAYQRGQQRHTCSKVPRRVAFPSDKPLRVFQGNASARPLCHGHNLASFTGKHLSLRTGFDAPVNAVLLVHRAPVTLSFQYRPQVWPLVSIAPCNGGSRADITAEPAVRLLDFRQWDRHTHAGVPLAVLSEHLGALLQGGTGQGQRPVNRPVPVRGNVEPALFPACGCGAPQHDPQVKALRLPGLLHLRAVDQFGPEKARRVTSLRRSLEVDRGAAVGSPNELTVPFRAGEAALSLSHEGCAIRVRALKESRQKRERIGLIRGREQFELVGQVHGLHSRGVANGGEKTRTPPRAKSRSRPTMDGERPLRLRPLRASTDG
jgi:hypothetical protein